MNLSYRITKLVTWTIFHGYFRCKLLHIDRIPMEGKLILACNHCSFLDPLLLGGVIPREIHFLARDSLFRFPMADRYLKSINSIAIDREGKSPSGIKGVIGALKRQQSVLLFPEGTRSHDGSLQPAKTGVGMIIASSHAPVLPIRIFGSYEAYNRRSKFPKPVKLTAVFGKPVDYEHLLKDSKSKSKAEKRRMHQEIADDIMKQIGTLNMDPEKAQS
ncbi:MAG TPA: 1-acyl-sn-glycerol-3-phosphate acyltransferase [Verrucomicrobiales bacterium]|nr:1-acyl-sn-glycerol-3-phosphate acyltransferase [Verrucomicrobiales bacterium]HIL70958.1 1-acyl-sn-glycerol-3-phosphate acyltransferase [Verrucomicrobiota bacterium]